MSLDRSELDHWIDGNFGRDESLCERHEIWHDSGGVCRVCEARYIEAQKIKQFRKKEYAK